MNEAAPVSVLREGNTNRFLETAPPNPSHIMKLGTAFMESKTLLSAVELGLFTALGTDALTGQELCQRLGLHPRANPDFFDALVALRVLERDGDGQGARYHNTTEAGLFLDKTKPSYIGGILEMANSRLYSFWGDLTEALTTGQPQNEVKTSGKALFEAMYADPDRTLLFLEGMSGVSKGNFIALAEKYNFARHQLLCDVGGALGLLSTIVARQHPHLKCITADIAPVTPLAARCIASQGLQDRIEARMVDMFAEDLPRCDVMTMSLILHDWNLEKKKQLIKKAYEALEPGGAFIAIDHMIDNARRENVTGLMISLTMLIETGDGFDYTPADFFGWCEEAGFRRGEVIPLTGPASAAVVYKPQN